MSQRLLCTEKLYRKALFVPDLIDRDAPEQYLRGGSHVTQTRVLPPVSSIREIDEQVLPIPRVEIELSDIEDDLASASDWGDASRVMALVRLHTYPLGVVYLDGRLGPSRRLHAAGIWTVLNEAINAHLSADGLPVASRIDDVVVASTSGSPRCLQYRDSVLSRGSFISVVVATRDRPDSLAACLKSLLRSSYQHFEIIVVDNDPTSDDTELMIRRRFPSVRYPGVPARPGIGTQLWSLAGTGPDNRIRRR